MTNENTQGLDHTFDGVPLVTKKPRKQRSDKGQKRGPRKKKEASDVSDLNTTVYADD